MNHDGRQLAGRVAIVTGASQGIGEAIAMAYASAGAAVVVTARRRDALERVAGHITGLGGSAQVVAADLGDPAGIPRIAHEALARFGRIDVLVNNAAIIHPFVDMADFDPELWRKVIEVNLVAPALLSREVLRTMIAQRSGKIINISSIGGRKGGKGRSAYRAAKAGLINLTESLAAEVKAHGIDVNCICPGGVDTEGMREAFGSRVQADSKLMKPEEIAEVALFLASEASSAITGTAIDAFGLTNPVFR
jgi:NAD(P)-dependent dehydrogenase (short-subunit alcohol dehydrogenase family)